MYGRSRRHRWQSVVGGGVGTVGAGSAGRIMDLETTARDECCASRLPRMRDELAVLGGDTYGVDTSSCEALAIGDDEEHWEPLLPMHDNMYEFACAAVAGCVIVAGGLGHKSAEVYDEMLGRWLRLPRDLPHAVWSVGSTLL